MALKGRAGQRFSHAPQPIHLSVLTTAIFGEFSSAASFATICMAPEGQCRAQLPHSTPSVRGMQFFLTHTAGPILVEDFCSAVIGRMALVGHTSAQRVHSGRQYPRSYDISGCMNRESSVEGRSTPLGHADTHSWHEVQCCEKCCALKAPAGSIGVVRLGTALSSTTANPPSTFFFCASTVTPAATNAVAVRKDRRALFVLFVLFALA